MCTRGPPACPAAENAREHPRPEEKNMSMSKKRQLDTSTYLCAPRATTFECHVLSFARTSKLCCYYYYCLSWGRVIACRQNILVILWCVQAYSTSYRISLSAVCCLCALYAIITDGKSCRRPISTNLGPMETGEYGLTRGTFFVALSLEVVAVT